MDALLTATYCQQGVGILFSTPADIWNYFFSN
jgi:hypothetical protein